MRRIKRSVLLFILAAGLPGRAASVLDEFNPGADNQPRAIAVQADGKIVVGGYFTTIGGAARNYLARLNSDGSVDADFNPNPNFYVLSLAVQEDGKILVGGSFSSIAGTSRNRIARLNADGSVDAGFDPNANGSVEAIAVQAGGGILLGGAFTSVAGVARNRVARLNADGSVDGTFNPNADDIVSEIAVQPDGKIVLAGAFTAVGGLGRNRIARLNTGGGVDTGFNPGSDGSIASLVLQADSKILLGGSFSVIGGASRSNMARLNTDGSVDSGFAPNPDGGVEAVAVQSDGKILAAGSFLSMCGLARDRIARLNPGGDLDTAFAPAANSAVVVVATQTDGKILIGGQFNQVNGQTRSKIARLHPDGSLEVIFTPSASAGVEAIAIQPDGRILVGGEFTSINGVARNRIARLNMDGSLDGGFDPGTNGVVHAIAVQPDGKVLAAGNFTTAGGQARTYIARFNGDGSLDAGFNPVTDNEIFAVALQADGKILVGGHLTVIGGYTRNHIARLNADGSVDTGFAPTVNERVYGLAVQPDGRILVGGWFSAVNGYSRSNIARLLANGSLDTSFNPGANNWVNAFLVQPDGNILVGGAFSYIAGQSKAALTRLYYSGYPDGGFTPNAGGEIHSIALTVNGKILVGGEFSQIGGTARNNIAALNSNGSLDSSFDPNANNAVFALGLQKDGKILVGGWFTAIGGQGRSRIARISAPDAATQSLDVSGDGTTVTWSRSRFSPEVVDVEFEHSADLAVWTDLGSATRVSGGWQLSGLSLPFGVNGYIRGRGKSLGGRREASASVVESIRQYFNPSLHAISGTITLGGAPLADVVMSGLPGDPVSNTSGFYSASVASGWSGTVTPVLAGHVFSPSSRAYVDVAADQDAQDYTAALVPLIISGTVTLEGEPLAGVVMNGLPGDPSTNASGFYSATVSYGWSGTVTPTLAGYSFTPADREYSAITSDQTAQDYAAAVQTYSVSGTVTTGGAPLTGVVISGLPGSPVTNGSGFYTATVDYGWSGTATPELSGYQFIPASRAYSNVTADQAAQDYSAVLGIPGIQREALIALYNATNGDSWTDNSGWKTPPLHSDGFAMPGTEGTWKGVYLDSGSSRVVSISLWQNNLVGTLPDSLGDLGSLEMLNIHSNQISGCMPASLGNLSSLQYFFLYNNQLSGSIPSEHGNMISMMEYRVYNNQLTGSIPTSFGNFTNLTFLYLFDNQLTGSIPAVLGSLLNTQNICLRNNQLSGTIPPELGNLTLLNGLDLSNNQLSGEIPSSLGALVNLRVLLLHKNQLTGTIPASLGSLASLTDLLLYDNQLSGAIPPEIGGLAGLTHLFLYDNQLTGSIPPEIGNLGALVEFIAHTNQLSGPIPSTLGNLHGLQQLILHDNQLTGSIPAELGSASSSLQYLELNGNQLSGGVPASLGSIKNLYSLRLGDNGLSGAIPAQIGALSNLLYLELRGNHLSGSLPSELGNLANLMWLDLKGNMLSGSIPVSLTGLVRLNEGTGFTDIGYNALQTADPGLIAFLDSKDPDWALTQTIAPNGVAATPFDHTTIDLSWDVIPYSSDSGGYRVAVATTPGGPYSFFQQTADKTCDSLPVSGLTPETTYYFVVSTRTEAHDDNQNEVDSENSLEVSAVTPAVPIMITVTSPNGGETWAAGSTHEITWTSSGAVGDVDIDCSIDGGSNWTAIVSGTVNDGSHGWTIPNSPSSACLVRVRETDGSPGDQSDAVFTIVYVAPPEVVSVAPGINASNAARAANITVTFDQDMDAASLNEVTFVVYGLQTGLRAGAYSYDNGTRTATFDPANAFAAGEVVTVSLTTSIQSAVGVRMDEPFEWTFTAAVDGGHGTFSTPAPVYAAGTSTAGAFPADLDGDGDIDLAAANSDSNDVSVLLNQGDGTFAAPAPAYGVGTSPRDVWAGDFDGDGDIDLAAANGIDSTVSVLLNNGDGTFATPAPAYGVGANPNTVMGGDLDGDGDIDLATVNTSANSVSVLLNNGDGTFATPAPAYGVGLSPRGMYRGDFDGDGDIDLVTANYSSNSVSILMNNGDGTFATPAPSYAAGGNSRQAYAADFDNDGDIDVVTANEMGDNITVLKNNGNGTFASPVSYSVCDGNRDVFGGDFDGDGDIDLATGSYDLFVLLNNGNGTFASAVQYATNSINYMGLCGSDLDGDGDFDLALAGGGSNNVSILLNQPPPSIVVTAPNGGESWTVGTAQDITWTSAGAVGDVDIDCSSDGGLNWTAVAGATANDGIHPWTVPDTPSTSCLVRVRETDGSPSDQSDAVFTIVAVETISAPTAPAGPASGATGVNYSYSTAGSASNLGHELQYFFDWDDGTDSGWLAVGTTSASHSWAAAGTYDVRAKARCAVHMGVESPWSASHAVIVSGGGGAYYNSPAQRLILPEATWAPASGGGDWISELQLVDCTGGSTVQVYYCSGTSRRGPFTLWDNAGGAAGSSAVFGNIVETIDGLDGEAFAYYGTGGALELVTQDGAHLLQAAVRTRNGSYSRTFPGLQDREENTAAGGRVLLVPNLCYNGFYRPSLVLYNPSADSVTVDVTIVGGDGAQLGSTISRSLAGYEQNTIVDELRAFAYDNAKARVQVTGGAGRVIVSGQSANNMSNDPAAHVAVQEAGSYVNSPAQRLILPEATWAPASGGGDWISELQLVDCTGGSTVQVYYCSGTSRRGPFTLWDNAGGAAGSSAVFGNIVETIDGLDGEAFAYYGTGGALELVTQDGAHLLQAAVRTRNGSYSRTFPGLQDREENTAAGGRVLLVPNLCYNGFYRPSLVLYNPSADSVTVDVTIVGGDGAQLGSTISRSLAGYEQNTIVDELRAFAYDNAKARVQVTGGAGRVIASGQSASNMSNDPAAHVAVQGQ
jgi:uncharacterized delta-60 repeat protein